MNIVGGADINEIMMNVMHDSMRMMAGSALQPINPAFPSRRGIMFLLTTLFALSVRPPFLPAGFIGR